MWPFFVLVAATLLSWAATWRLIPLLRRANILDEVNHRSSHTSQTVRGGGLAVLTIFTIVAGVVLLFGPSHVRHSGAVAIVVLAVLGYGVVGWVEDAHGLSVRGRLSLQLAIGAAASVGAALLGAPPVLCVLATLAAVFYVNASNFMDGINGISSLHGVTVGVYFALVGHHTGNVGLMLVALTGAGAFLGFLPWNFPKAKIFLGDVGSYTLGALVWVLCFWAAAEGPVVVAAAPMAIYTADVLFTLWRRARRRERLSEAHREHVYQRLQQATGSHAAAAGVVTVATVLTCAVGGLVLLEQLSTPAGVVSLIVIVTAFCALPTVRRHARGEAR